MLCDASVDCACDAVCVPGGATRGPGRDAGCGVRGLPPDPPAPTRAPQQLHAHIPADHPDEPGQPRPRYSSRNTLSSHTLLSLLTSASGFYILFQRQLFVSGGIQCHLFPLFSHEHLRSGYHASQPPILLSMWNIALMGVSSLIKFKIYQKYGSRGRLTWTGAFYANWHPMKVDCSTTTCCQSLGNSFTGVDSQVQHAFLCRGIFSSVCLLVR